MKLLAGQVRAIGRPDRTGLGEVATKRDALAFDTFGGEWIVVGDARHRAGEMTFFLAEQHVHEMYRAMHTVYTRASPSLVIRQ
jgi:hypothetical protein